MELWGRGGGREGGILKLVASQFRRVLKVNGHIMDCSRAKFVCIYVELDLEQPFQQGTSVNYGGYSVFVLVLYEKLPIFCYRCGRVGHGKANCSFTGSHLRPGSHVPLVSLSQS